MKKTFILTIVYVFAITQVIGQGIEFGHSWEEAQKKAKEENKIIFVDAYASWCGPCKRLAKKIFPLEEVGSFFNAHFINLKLDMEKPNAKAFRSKHPVGAYPTLFFIAPDGKVVHKVRGAPRTSDALIAQARLAFNKFDPTQDLQKQYESGARDKAFYLKYVTALRKSGKSTAKLLNEYLKMYPDLSSEEDLKFVFEATESCDSKAFDLLVKNKKPIRSLVGETQFRARVAEACQNTVSKAIDFKVEDLLREAKSKMKQHNPLEYDRFSIDADMQYYSALKDSKNYLKAAKKYVKKYTKHNLHKQYLTAHKIFKTFPLDKKVISYANKLLAKAADIGGRPEYLVLQSKLLFSLDKKKEALSAAKKALALAGEYGEKTNTIQQLIGTIQGKLNDENK